MEETLRNIHMETPILFRPTTEVYCKYNCRWLGLPDPVYMEPRQRSDAMHQPSILELNAADGNCFFLKINREVTGNQDLHDRIRAITVQFMLVFKAK